MEMTLEAAGNKYCDVWWYKELVRTSCHPHPTPPAPSCYVILLQYPTIQLNLPIDHARKRGK